MKDQKLRKNDAIYLAIAFLIVIYFLVLYPITTENIKEKDLPNKKVKIYHINLNDGTEIDVYNVGMRPSNVPLREIGITIFILLAVLLYVTTTYLKKRQLK